MRARSTCLRSRLRSSAIAISRSRSAAFTITQIVCAMAPSSNHGDYRTLSARCDSYDWVITLGLFGLEEAVRRMTGLPARRFSLTGRGSLAPGAYADVTVFDPETVIDRATFEVPTTPASGIDHVLVNGRPVWAEGKTTGEHPGRALRRQKMQAEAR